MKIKEMNAILKDKNSQDLNCNFKITGKSKSKFDIILQRLDKIDEFIVEQREFNKKIMSRIDNLIIKNNLKE